MLLEWLHVLWTVLTWQSNDSLVLAAAYGTSILISLAVSLASTAVSLGVSALLAPNTKGPRQKDSGIQSSDYGSPIPLRYGPTTRGAGQVIYYSGLQEQKRKKSGSGGSTTTFTYTCTAAIAFGQGVPGALLARVWAQKKIIYENGELVETGKIKHGVPVLIAEDITFYDGSADQLPDPTLESYLGMGTVQAYRHTMYMVVKNIALAELGPSCPFFEAEIRAHDEISPADVVTDFATRAGVSIDVSMLAGNVGTLDGYTVDQEVSVSDAIAPLSLAYSFDPAERGGEMVCVPRGMGPVATILRGDMGAIAFTDGGAPGEFEHSRLAESDLPAQVAVTYRDIFRDMQPLTQRAERNLGNAKENIKVDLPLSLDANQARRIAHRILWGSILARRKAKGSLSQRWKGVLPGDVVNLEAPTGALLPYRLERATEGADGRIEVEFGYEDADIYNCAVIGGQDVQTGGDGDVGDGGATGPSTWIPLDIPILRDSDNNAGFFWAVNGTASRWGGSQVYRSTDGGTDYEPVGPFLGPSTVGMVALATPSGTCDMWDRTTVITVVIEGSGELESRSEVSILNGQNAAYIGPTNGFGGEIIQFATATIIAPKTYELTNLLRGRRGTEWAAGNHGTDERFVLLSDSAAIARQDFGASDLNLERLYKPVSVGEAVEDATAVPFTNTGEALRPFSPARLVGRRQPDGTLDVSWLRRSRLVAGGLGAGGTPVGEDLEGYQLDIYSDEAMANRVWTATLENQSSFTFTTEAQVAAGLTVGDPVWLDCRQQSAIRGLGHSAYAVAE